METFKSRKIMKFFIVILVLMFGFVCLSTGCTIPSGNKHLSSSQSSTSLSSSQSSSSSSQSSSSFQSEDVQSSLLSRLNSSNKPKVVSSGISKVTVKTFIKIISIIFIKTNIEIFKGDKLTITATISPSTASNKTLVWSSSNNNVATVSSDGVVTAINIGTATISATAADGSEKKMTSTVTILDPTIPRIFSVTESNAKITGRFYKSENAIFANYTCSSYEFNFKGTSASADIVSKGTGSTTKAIVAVYVDNQDTPSTILKISGTSTQILAKNLPDGNHSIKLLKLSEDRYTTFGLSKIILSPRSQLLSPPAPKALKIEIIGDSITCGAGNIAPAYNSAFTTDTEDGSKSFGYLIAQSFNADIQYVSSSGQGVYSYGTGLYDNAMPKVYDKVDMTYSPNEKWDFNKFQPNLIIVALGTNDIWALPGGKPVPRNEYKVVLKAFIKDLRVKNPNATIVWTYGMMLQHYQSEYAEVVNDINNEGDQKVFFIPMEAEKESDRRVGHPSASYHKWAAQFMVPELSEIMHWGYKEIK
jgi:hypothetical protein